MLLVSAVNVALGWAWHVAYRARYQWRLRREGALAAAAAVALVGTVHSVHSAIGTADRPAPAGLQNLIVAPVTGPLAASTTSVVTDSTPMQIGPADAAPAIGGEPVQTMAATPSPVVEPAPDDAVASAEQPAPADMTATAEPVPPKDDPIGQKILERLGDAASPDAPAAVEPAPVSQGAINPDDLDPVDAATLVQPKPADTGRPNAKPAKVKKAEIKKAEPRKVAKAADRRHPRAAD